MSTRQKLSVVTVVACLVLVGVFGSAGAVASPAAGETDAETTAPSLDVTVETTGGDALTGGEGTFSTPYRVADGQGVQITVEWTDVPVGREIQVVDVDDPGDSTGRDVFSTVTVQSRSGSETVTISGSRLATLGPKDTAVPSFVRIEFAARLLDDGSLVQESDAEAIELVSQPTVYVSSVTPPASPGGDATVSFYGWDDGSTVTVSAETVAGATLATSTVPVDDENSPAFTGILRFDPSAAADASGVVRIQLITASTGPSSNVVEVRTNSCLSGDLSRSEFDTVAGADGTLDRSEVLGLVRAYVGEMPYNGVTFSRTEVLAIVRCYLSR